MEAAEINLNIVRQDRILALKDKLKRINYALTNFRYTNSKDILEDFAAFVETEKELQIQQAYLLLEA